MVSGESRHRPNIVFVFSDQHRARTTGYRGARVHTPNMDRMAAEGVVFDTAVSNIPVCTPWRAAFLTGQYPLTNGLFLNDLRLPADRPSLGTILTAAGYVTAYIGKWHLDGNRRAAFTPPGPRRQGFQFWAVANCTHDYTNSHYYRDTPERLYWDGYDAEAQTTLAIDYIRSQAGSAPGSAPFALVLSWGPPHNPYRDLPRRYLDRYPPAEVEVPPNCPDPVREDLAGYHAHVTALDEQLGRIEAALAAEGVLENTIFVYTSDHGDMLGSQGVNRKQHPWDESILVPFLLRCRGQAGRGRRISFPLNVVDILPTLLGLAGVPIPATVEGRDLSPAVRGEPFAGNEHALTMCIAPFAEYFGAPWRGVRGERYSYARWLDGRGILYDTAADPDQLRNLFREDRCRSIRAELEDALQRLLAQRGDRFQPASAYREQYGYTVDERGAVPYEGRSAGPTWPTGGSATTAMIRQPGARRSCGWTATRPRR